LFRVLEETTSKQCCSEVQLPSLEIRDCKAVTCMENMPSWKNCRLSAR